MNTSPLSRKCSSRQGFSLVELALALGVAGFCLTTVLGLLPVGLASNQVSLNQTVAANITSAIQSDLNCTPLASGTSPEFGFAIPSAGNSTTLETIYLTADGIATARNNPPTATGTAASRYRATLWFNSPAQGQRTATAVRILVTWPALADGNPASSPQYYTGSYEADTTLNRN